MRCKTPIRPDQRITEDKKHVYETTFDAIYFLFVFLLKQTVALSLFNLLILLCQIPLLDS